MKRTYALLTLLTAATVTVASTTLPVAADGEGAEPTNGQIVFRRYFDAEQTKGAIFVMDPDGSDARRITFPPEGWRDNVPAWSPDGSRIVFERFKSDDSTSRVMVVDPDTGETHSVVPCTGSTCAYAIDPYFAPDGGSIAYARTVVPPGTQTAPEWLLYSAIFIVGLDGSESRQVTSTPVRHRLQPPAFDTSDPTFSPDGTTLAFVRTHYRPRENSAVFVQPIDSPEEARRITPWTMNCQDRPTFSPDGRRLLFRCMPDGEDGPSNLYWVHPDGSGLRQVTFAPADRQYLGSGFSPSFHRGQGWITAGRTGGFGADGNADVFAILVRDGKVARMVNLTTSEQWDSGPGWSIHPPTSAAGAGLPRRPDAS